MTILSTKEALSCGGAWQQGKWCGACGPMLHDTSHMHAYVRYLEPGSCNGERGTGVVTRRLKGVHAYAWLVVSEREVMEDRRHWIFEGNHVVACGLELGGTCIHALPLKQYLACMPPPLHLHSLILQYMCIASHK